jgi:hypothetical protein
MLNIVFSIILVGFLEYKSVWRNQIWISLAILVLMFNLYSLLKEIRPVDSWNRQDYDIDFLHQVKKEINNLNPIGCYIKDKSDYNDLYSKNPTLRGLGSYLYLLSSNCDTVSLSVFDTPISNDLRYKKIEEEIISRSTFYRFVQTKKEKGIFLNIDEYKVQFLRENNIDFLITSKNTILPGIISDLVNRKIRDPISGEIFNILSK